MFTSMPNTSVREPVGHACGCCTGRTCDGLECICRPRFFAGQLLTDDDLRRLDHYIVAKGRLHNRYLHGTGAVCGLEVVCNPCDDTVTVRPGYAIGPCGEDIVVCRDTAVDVGDLVQAHRRKRTVDCDPYGGRPANEDCEAARQRWILAICYDERPARGVTSLRPTEPAKCGCTCPTCSCGGTTNGNGNGNGHRDDVCSCRTRPASTPAQCEPTVTCEGYRFTLVKEPRPIASRPGLSTSLGALTSSDALADSELGRRVHACLTDITTRVQHLGQAGGSTAALVELCCQLKVDLRDIIETGNVHDCMIGSRLSDIVCPDPADQDANQRALDAIHQMLLLAIDLFKSCVCSALLPPCGVGSPDDCIPLATLTVRTADLRVLDICNWSSRRFAVNFPMLGYWLGWLPIFDTLRAAVARLCCAPTRRTFQLNDNLKVRAMAASDTRNENFAAAAGPATAAAPGAAGAPTSTPANAVLGLAAQYARHTTPLSGLEATVLAALGVTADDDTPVASDLELEHPLAALALARLAAPTIRPTVPDDFTPTIASMLRGVLGAETPPSAPGEGPAPAAEQQERVTRLEAAVEGLQKTVRSQARTIGKLRKQVGEQ